MVTATQVPLLFEVPHDSHWPVHAESQQTPSTQWWLPHSLSPPQLEPFDRATQFPVFVSQAGVFPPQLQQAVLAMHEPLHSFMVLEHPALPPLPVAGAPPLAVPPDPVPVMPPLELADRPPEPDPLTMPPDPPELPDEPPE